MPHTFTAGFLFSGSGLAALGAAQASGALGLHTARCHVIGGVDNDPVCAEDFSRFTGAPCAVADVSKMQMADLVAALGAEAPDVLVCTPPCKGFSRLISRAKAATAKYQALNRLVLQGIELALTTWAHRPPPIILLENVEGIRTSGAELLTQVRALLTSRGYALNEDTHDAGEIGGLAQHRRRFLMVARHVPQVPQLLYKPVKQRVRACGDVLGPLLLPNDPAAGPLHRLPDISFRTWVRLANIRAGKDWRDLQRFKAVALQHAPRRGTMKVTGFDAPADTVRGRADVRTGPAAVADPKVAAQLAMDSVKFNHYLRTHGWDEPCGAVTSGMHPSSGVPAACDPRVAQQLALGAENQARHEAKFRVLGFDEPAHAVTGTERIGSGAPSVADPKVADLLALGRTADASASYGGRPGLMGVNDWNEPAPTVTGTGSVTSSNMPAAVADPLSERLRVDGEYRNTTLGVTPWWAPAPTITGSAQIDNGAFSVGQPLPSPPFPPGYLLLTLDEAHRLLLDGWEPPKGTIPVIIAPDGTWHRPLTLLELAVLQGMPATWQGQPLTMAGGARAKIAEHIGNGLPVGTMQATMGEMLRTLLATKVGAAFMDGSLDVWVDPWREEVAA